MAFPCNIFGYRVAVPSGQTNSRLFQINLFTGQVNVLNPDIGLILNAIGYNTIDNLIYGIQIGTTNLISIDETGTTTNYGPVPNLPSIGYPVGAADDNGYLYIYSGGTTTFYTIDINQSRGTFGQLVDPTAGYILDTAPFGTPLPQTLACLDWAYSISDGMLYGVNSGGASMTIVDPTTGNVIVVPLTGLESEPSAAYGSQYTLAESFLYATNNTSGNIYRVDISGGPAVGVLYSTDAGSSQNDGASCVLASLLIDFGDAPDTDTSTQGQDNYRTLLGSDGPRHLVDNNLVLGSQITSESDAYENSTATGDDISQGIQDDGVATPVEFVEGTVLYPLDIGYTNNTGSNANIYAWIDFNRDGIFQLEEGINPVVVASDPTNPRVASVQFLVPSSTVLTDGDTTFLRVRLTTDDLVNTNTLPTEEDTRSFGPANDGEVEDYLVTVTPRPSFPCEPTAYQVLAETNPNTGTPFNSQFRSIDPVTGVVTIINPNMGAIMNAIAYNPIDNYIYGIYDVNDVNAGNLARISADGVVTNLGPIPNLSNLNMTNGAIDNRGFFYLKNQGDDEYFVVDLRSGSANFGQLVDPTAGYILATPPYSTPIAPAIGNSSGDWVFNPIDNLLYTTAGGQFYTIGPTTGISTPIPTEAGFPYDYGGMFNDANGFIYGINNPTGAIIRWQDVGGTMDGDFFSISGPSQRQDATMCIRASILMDFGDAPDTSLGTGIGNYNTLLVSNGPRHGIVNNLTLGTQVTSEDDARQNVTATGDDIPAGIQDDGPIGILEPIIGGNSTYTLPISYVNDTGETAIIYAWVDFNRNGIFELQEGISVPVPSSGTNPRVENLVFNIPPGTTFTSGDLTFIRTRITTDNLVNSNILATQEDTRSLGPASDGEVEDYQVEIIVLNIEGTIWYDLNCNGIREVGEPLAEGITVELYDANNANLPLEVTTTDSNGFYSFNNLPSGEYYVKVILPSGYEYTLSNIGNNDSIDSDVDGALGESPVFELSAQNQLEIVDAGLCRLNKITGQAFFDCNEDGIFDLDEKLLCGVVITLLNEYGVELGTVSTDCDGRYEFTDLPPGTYTVIVTNPSEMTYVVPVPGDFYGSKPDNITGEFQVTLTNEDYLQGFAGFIGGLGLKMEFCIECSLFCNTCSKGLETVNKSCICTQNEDECISCNKECIGCKVKKSNRKNRENSGNCSVCDNGCN